MSFGTPNAYSEWDFTPPMGNPSAATMREPLKRLMEFVPSGAAAGLDSSHSLFNANLHRQLEVDLAAIAQLTEGWDGEGALPIAAAAIESARNLLWTIGSAIRIPEVDPNPNGTLSLRWVFGDGFAELEIGATTFSWALVLHGNKPILHGSGATSRVIPDLSGTELFARIALDQPDLAAPITSLRMSHSWMIERRAA